jgi:hypothetical protein
MYLFFLPIHLIFVCSYAYGQLTSIEPAKAFLMRAMQSLLLRMANAGSGLALLGSLQM